MQHWRPYLWGHMFRIRTGHSSLKFLLDQRISMPPQQHWISKLMGFDFTMEHKPGPLNRAADALSHQSDAAMQLAAISHPTPLLLEAIRQEHQSTTELRQLFQKITEAYHDSVGEGLQKSLRGVHDDFYWAGLRSHIAEYAAACLNCQRNKATIFLQLGYSSPSTSPLRYGPTPP
ncbi:uncharacterized protein [Aristolochia californica]|uniref:uncharacterized protein n=1 Tax=Aristolochia californica TaxID=171875 RepID=UPI0035D5707D